MSNVNDPADLRLSKSNHGSEPEDVHPTNDQLATAQPVDRSTSPIFELPVEILCSIIEFGLVGGDQERFPLLVSHICTRLRDVVLAHPLLWTKITFTGGRLSYSEVEARLARSRDCPLDISVRKLDSVADAEDMMRLLFPHVGRWRHFALEVVNPDAARLIVDNLVDPAPQLESLVLSGPLSTRVFNPFGGKTPALKSLRVKNMPVFWESTLLDTVETLHINAPSWTNTSLLGKWRNVKKLTIRSDPLQPLIFSFPIEHVVLPELECLELNGLTEEDIVRLLSHTELPNLSRMLFSHIKDSRNNTVSNIYPLPSVKSLRLHATEMCQDNLLSVLRKVRNLENISFEDSSPIPSFIGELTLTSCDEPESWVIPALTNFKVIAFEKDNAQRVYDDTDIAEALKHMMIKRKPVCPMSITMCVFQGDRDDETRHAADWGVERPYKSVRFIQP